VQRRNASQFGVLFDGQFLLRLRNAQEALFFVSRAPHKGQAIASKHDHSACMAEAVAAAEARTMQSDARLTPLRRRVLELVSESHVPVGAYDLLARLEGERKGRAAPPTIYRALDFLMEHGLIHRITSLNAYVACFGPHRPHDACLFICERCRTVEESEAPALRRAIEREAADTGFRVHGQTIEISGVCRSCAEIAQHDQTAVRPTR
jgi:Fur family zinc uptake transcriptional regulator